MSMEGEGMEKIVENTMLNLALDLERAIHIDGDYEHARLLCKQFIWAVEALLTLRKMRSEGVVFVVRRS